MVGGHHKVLESLVHELCSRGARWRSCSCAFGERLLERAQDQRETCQLWEATSAEGAANVQHAALWPRWRSCFCQLLLVFDERVDCWWMRPSWLHSTQLNSTAHNNISSSQSHYGTLQLEALPQSPHLGRLQVSSHHTTFGVSRLPPRLIRSAGTRAQRGEDVPHVQVRAGQVQRAL
jgi:hypothetical protein